jgi:uncharacterized protein
VRVEKGSGKKGAAIIKSRGKASLARPPGLFFIACLLFLVWAGGAHGLEVPPLKGYVNDYANMMSRETRARLENELRDFEQSDSTQVVVLTVESLEGDVLESFSIRVAEKWKIGQKGKDNGVLLLAVKKERKTRIEVGRGLEGKLTDLTAGRIVQLVINPQFKRGDFNAGFTSGIRAVIDATRGEFKVDKVRRSPSTRGIVSSFMPLIVFGAVCLLVLGRISRYLGGAAGLIGFPLVGSMLGLPLAAIIFLGFLGLSLGIFLPLFFGGSFGGAGGYSHGVWGTGGGFGSGGSDGNGGFDGGGGDFGGGGASGDW